MKDSLHVTDAVITQVLNSRNNYFRKIEEVHKNIELTNLQQHKEVSILKKYIKDDIRLILGNEIYNKYVEIIKNRMRKKSVIGEPLAGD